MKMPSPFAKLKPKDFLEKLEQLEDHIRLADPDSDPSPYHRHAALKLNG